MKCIRITGGARLAVLAGALGLGWTGWAVAADEVGRQVTPLDGEWSFHRGDGDGDGDGAIADTPDADWVPVRLPHTWNGTDAEDGGDYYRGPGWYRTTIDGESGARARTWLEFDGAALVADVWVNGAHIGRHEGGYARFRFDITDALKPGPDVLAVRVDNAIDDNVAPLGGDFTVFGGLYRPVRLIVTAPVHIDLADHGGPGVYMTTGDPSGDHVPDHLPARIVARLANDGDTAFQGRLRSVLTDADGGIVLDLTTPVAIPAGQTVEAVQEGRIDHPRPWRGRADPHLYGWTTQVLDADGLLLDTLRLETGIRQAAVDPDRGFILNGRATPLMGVNYFHAGRPGRGLAVRDAEIDADFEIMDEQGGTAIRFVHFQHPQRAYDLADRLGFAVWTEIPLNAQVSAAPGFAANLAQQMRELIRQNRHHPSVVIWGLGNEVYSTEDVADASIALAERIAKQEDPATPTAYAHCCQGDLDRKALHADLTAYNRYYGWYDQEFAQIGVWADERRAADPARPFAVSEYGAGASVLQQQDPPERPVPDGAWHPEQYQTAFHEAYWRTLRDRPYLWGAFIWVGFDLSSAGRDEGDRPGINDKGLVTYDRSVRKDAWYWYQANWSAVPMAHLTNRRLTDHPAGPVAVRAYSNLDRLGLFVNGVSAGEAEVDDHVALWSSVPLKPGLNHIEARGREGVVDEMWWTGAEARPTDLRQLAPPPFPDPAPPPPPAPSAID